VYWKCKTKSCCAGKPRSPNSRPQSASSIFVLSCPSLVVLFDRFCLSLLESLNTLGSAATAYWHGVVCACWHGFVCPCWHGLVVLSHNIANLELLHRWSLPIAAVASVWLLFASAIFMLPQAYPITTDNNNYAPAAVGGILLAALAAWLVSARHWFAGPLIDVDNSDAVKTKYWITDPPRRG